MSTPPSVPPARGNPVATTAGTRPSLIFASPRFRLQILLAILAVGLAVALWPFLSGLIGGAVLFVLFRPFYEGFRRWASPHVSAVAVAATAAVILVVPGVVIATLMVAEAQDLAGRLTDQPVFGRLAELQVGSFVIGPHIVAGWDRMIEWLGSNLFDLFGRAARGIINVVIAMFGLFFLLLRSDQIWLETVPYFPFSGVTAERLRRRFYDVTLSTLIGTGLTALAQGALVGVAFAMVGVASPIFWAVVTAVFSAIPFVGSGVVWGPAVIALFALDRYTAAIGLAAWGIIVVASVDNVIRPIVYSKWAQVHPMVTVVGVVAGVRFFGVLGLILGPLMLSYFFEFARIYRDECLSQVDAPR